MLLLDIDLYVYLLFVFLDFCFGIVCSLEGSQATPQVRPEGIDAHCGANPARKPREQHSENSRVLRACKFETLRASARSFLNDFSCFL